jgi:hypothetical protein
MTVPATSDIFIATPIAEPKPVATPRAREQAARSVVIGGGLVAYQLDVIETLKGAATGRVTLITGADSASCGTAFRMGARYLVFAHRQAGALRSGLCDFNVEGEHDIGAAADEVRRMLGGGAKTP